MNLPLDFVLNDEQGVISNEDGINHKVADQIKGKELYAEYYAYNFFGHVWWDATKNLWCCDVFQYGGFMETVLEKELVDLKTFLCEKYGYE